MQILIKYATAVYERDGKWRNEGGGMYTGILEPG